jgi:putative hydrolase
MLKIDLHIHTVHSGHAYGSIYDVLEEAARKKMHIIAITDHGPDMLGSASLVHFKMGSRAPKEYKGVKVLWGCEANIIDSNGSIDLPEKVINKIDILLVGLHTGTSFRDLGRKKNTEAIVKCLEKYKPHVFTHPSTLYFDYDIEKACQAACDNNVLLEINLSSLVRLDKGHHREDVGLTKKMVSIAKKNKKMMIVNSDAHFLSEIAEDKILKKYMEIFGLTDDMIINNNPKELEMFLKR